MRDFPDDIVCFELGSEQPACVVSSEGLSPDQEAIGHLVENGVIEVNARGGQTLISGVDRVGLVQLPSGRRLVIRSKIENLVLLEWLSFLGVFPPLELWLPDAGVTTGADLHTCIARLFLHELERITRVHLRKDYTPVLSNETTIRGRILTTKLYRSLHRMPHIPQAYRSRTLDTPHNMVLALALDRLPLLLARSDFQDRRLLAHMRDFWAQVRRDLAAAASSVTEAQLACPPGYRAAIQLARLILIGAAIDADGGSGGQAFTLSLALVWERSLRKMVEQVCDETGFVTCPDSDRIRRWDDTAGRNDPTRWLAADVLAVREGVYWVLDAKYKRAFGNESRADRFQMCAYAVAFNAEVASLVYPLSLQDYDRRILLKTDIGSKHITIDSINLPMGEGPENCKVALTKVCRQVWSSPKM